MKKLITTFTLMCFFAFGALAQGNYTISGIVHDGNGAAVQNQMVWVYTDSSQTSFIYNSSAFTDAQGSFAFSIPNGCTPGPNVVFNVATYSCGTMLQQQVQNNQGTTCSDSVGFTVCSNVLTCSTVLYGIPDSTVNPNNYYFVGYPMQNGNMVNASSYNWSFGDSSANSSQASPQHTYTSPGVYTVCLLTTTTGGCTSSSCITITVNGGNACNAQFGYQAGQAGSTSYFNALYGANYQYAWTFGDGSSGTGQYPGHVYANAGVYTVCLTVNNPITGCSDTQCYNVSIQAAQTSFWLYGQVNLPGMGFLTPADYGTVYLIRHDSLYLTAIDTTSIDSGGYFFFSGVPAGAYLVKAALNSNSAFFANYLPTYHTSSLFWTTASDVLLLNTNVGNANINMIAGSNPGGPGFIGGSVLQGANRMASPGDPIVGISILLLDANNNPVASTVTDASGSYSFPGIAYGTYKIYAEVAGKTTVPSTVTINAANPTVNNVDLEVNSGNILFVRNIDAKQEAAAFGIYPNPTRDFLTVSMELKDASPVTVTIENELGQVVKSTTYKLTAGNNNITESLLSLSKGVYSISVTTNENRTSTRFVKSE
ncbi:MAG: carboxypeptidase regulatory-like domain-containing protein [Bacteroidetes bacterium]|nr:carboxypeptidase regulatory-like domain-containing protein [Bacteroidota bacterium]